MDGCALQVLKQYNWGQQQECTDRETRISTKSGQHFTSLKTYNWKGQTVLELPRDTI